MRVKGITDEDFVNYKKPSMFIAFPVCHFKCGRANCQNSELALAPDIEITKEEICERYISNPITEAFVFGGLDPVDTFMDMISLIDCIRNKYNIIDDIVIYTGYTEGEMWKGLFSKDPEVGAHNFKCMIDTYPNIIIKYGRYIPNEGKHKDKELGIELVSNNQYAVRYNGNLTFNR